jgi:hypothetical protein
LLEVLWELGEGRGLQLKIGAGWQIKDRYRYLAFSVLKSGDSCAGLQIAWHFEADTRAGRIGRF